MNDDAHSLLTAWMSGPLSGKDDVTPTIDGVLERDRAAREREHWLRVGGVIALVLLEPMMLWGAAYGITPLVRGAYALMAVGTALIVAAEWMYLDWSRQALPGPVDARSQLQKTAFMLGRQVMLMKTVPIWSSPIFLGTALIGIWLYRHRTHSGGVILWAVTIGGWLVAWLHTTSVCARLNERRSQVERLLSEL